MTKITESEIEEFVIEQVSLLLGERVVYPLGETEERVI